MGRLHQAKRGIGDNFTYSLRVPTFGKCQKKSWYQYIFFWKRGAGLQHAPCPAKSRGRHIVPMRLTNMPLWLYFRSVRSSEKSVKL